MSKRLTDTHKGAVAGDTNSKPESTESKPPEDTKPVVTPSDKIDDTLRRHKAALEELSKR